MSTPRPETLNRLTDIVFDKVMSVLRTPDKNAPLYELLSEAMTRLDRELDLPLRLSATIPSSTKLLIRSNRVLTGDGGQKSLPPDGVDFKSYPDTTIDFDNGAVLGGTVKRDGQTWSVPNITIGQYVRAGFAYDAADNFVDVTFSAASVTVSGLTDPGVLLDALGGTKLGYIDLVSDGVSSFKTPNAVSGFIENAVSGVPYIFRFLSGGGAGGAGDAGLIRTTLENQLQESTYELLTPVDFAVDTDTFVDGSSTGTYGGKKFTLNVSGQTFVSVNLLDADEFLAEPSILTKAEATVFWDSEAVDANAVYQFSRDGGNNYQTITMERVGNASNVWTGNHVFTEETNATLASNAAAQTSGYELNTTSQDDYQTSFQLSEASVLRVIDLLSFTKTGSPVGSYYVEIYDDNAGSPGNILATTAALSVSGVITGTVTVDVSDVALAPLTTYWIVVRTDAIYKASFSAGVTSLTLSLNGSGLRRTLKGIVLDLRLKVISSSALRILSGFGVLYEPSIGQVVGGSLRRDIKSFRTTDNLNSFSLNFIPDTNLLRIYHVETGQVYRFPSFTISGSTVTFPVNTFSSVEDELITLIFDQSEGTSFDNSDLNAALLSENHLGSTDGSLDKSANGYGIKLRRPDGTLRELALDDSDNIVIYSV
jgi:hypothetical protein